MAFNFRKFLKGLNLVPNASTQVSAKGDVEVLDSSGKLNYHNGTTASPVVTEGHTATLSNKTFSDAVTLAEIATPSTPSSGNGKIYFKSDGFLYQIDDAGSEIRVGSGVNTIGTIDSQTKSANGAVITSGVNLIMQTADSSNVGLVSTSAQTFAGQKTLTSSPIVQRATTSNEGAIRLHTTSTLDWSIGTGIDSVGSNLTFASGSGQTPRGIFKPSGEFQVGSSTTATSGQHEFYNSSTTNATSVFRNTSTSTSSDGLASIYIVKGSTTNTAGTNHFIDFTINAGGTNSGYIASNGANSAAFFNTSDIRLKQNISPMSGVLNQIMLLNPVTYNWKSDNSSSYGFIAQELNEVFPHLVAKPNDGISELDENEQPWAITETGFVPYLVKAIQELKQEIEALKAQIGGN